MLTKETLLEEGITTALLYLAKFRPRGKCVVSGILLTQTDSQSNCREKTTSVTLKKRIKEEQEFRN